MNDNGTDRMRHGFKADAPAATDGRDAAAETPQGGDASSAGESLEAQVTRLEAEKADLTDRLLRTVADMENLRRRAERETSDARRYAVTRFAGDMLQVGDNLRRALDAAAGAGEDALAGLVEGVRVTEREMDRLLERHEIVRMAPKGERFDPNRHQAMFEVEDASVPAGTVVQVVQDGYSIGDRVLRAPLVGVSKGGPKPAETAGAGAGAAAEGA